MRIILVIGENDSAYHPLDRGRLDVFFVFQMSLKKRNASFVRLLIPIQYFIPILVFVLTCCAIISLRQEALPVPSDTVLLSPSRLQLTKDFSNHCQQGL